MKLSSGFGVSILLTITASASNAYAACNSGQTGAIDRQIASIQAKASARGCSGAETGLFSICSEYRKRIAEAQRNRNALSGGCDVAAEERETDAGRTREYPDTPARRSRYNAGFKAGALTMCVRTSDGYIFPTPNSGFRSSAEKKEDLAAQCQLICGTPDMDVYRVHSVERDDENMTSLTTGKRYSELPNAGIYRLAGRVDRCDQSRYYKLAFSNSLMRPSISPMDTAPTISASLNVSGDVLDGAAILSEPVENTRTSVRLVGPRFFPE